MRYEIGQRWRCEKNDPSSFAFVVIAKGSKPDRKVCRVEYDKPNGLTRVDFEQEYTHKHLKKYGTLEVK